MRRLLQAACLVLLLGPAAAQEPRFLIIGTGGIGGTYYPIGGLIAQGISSPPGSRPCDRGGACGVPGLIAVAQSSHGSVANVEAIEAGLLKSAFVQSDIAYWAHSGTGIFEGRPPMTGLRAIAALYPESMHLVARDGAGIASVADLRGKRVALDEPGSGTLVDALLVLEAWGLSPEDLEPYYIKSTPAISRMEAGTLDAVFLVAGYPTASVAELAARVPVQLVPIDGPEAAALLEEHRFFASDMIPDQVYPNVWATPTISVMALWLIHAGADEDLVHAITEAMWNDATRSLLDHGHAKGQEVTLETALDGIAIPLHPGARRFYVEAGLLEEEAAEAEEALRR
jgi:uncharacterized protein